MSGKEAKKCTNCGGEMVKGDRLVGGRLWTVTLAKKGDIMGDKIIPFYCKDCWHIELYKTPPAPEAFFKKCVKCDKELPIASEECPYCGTEQPEYEES